MMDTLQQPTLCLFNLWIRYDPVHLLLSPTNYPYKEMHIPHQKMKALNILNLTVLLHLWILFEVVKVVVLLLIIVSK